MMVYHRNVVHIYIYNRKIMKRDQNFILIPGVQISIFQNKKNKIYTETNPEIHKPQPETLLRSPKRRPCSLRSPKRLPETLYVAQGGRFSLFTQPDKALRELPWPALLREPRVTRGCHWLGPAIAYALTRNYDFWKLRFPEKLRFSIFQIFRKNRFFFRFFWFF